MFVHAQSSSSIEFTPSSKGFCLRYVDYALYCEQLHNDILKANLQRALMAHKLQNIVMRPGTRKFEDVVIEHLVHCTVTKADIRAADNIFGKILAI
jgi:hypothetical protein